MLHCGEALCSGRGALLSVALVLCSGVGLCSGTGALLRVVWGLLARDSKCSPMVGASNTLLMHPFCVHSKLLS